MNYRQMFAEPGGFFLHRGLFARPPSCLVTKDASEKQLEVFFRAFKTGDRCEMSNSDPSEKLLLRCFKSRETGHFATPIIWA